MKLSPISLAMVPLLTVFSASAAVYQVVDLGEVVDARATYAAAVNDQGISVLNGQGLYSVSIDISLIDFDNEVFATVFSTEQIAELKSGELTATTNGILYGFLLRWPEQFNSKYNPNSRLPEAVANLVERYEFQPVSSIAAYVDRGQTVEPLRFRTTETEIGNDERVVGMNNLNMQVGFATPPFEYIEFTRTTDPDSLEDGEESEEPSVHMIWRPSGAQRLGVVRVNDERLTLTPVYSDFGGGLSAAYGISDEGMIIGTGSVDIDERFIALVDENCRGYSAPVENCLHYFHSINNGYVNRAMTWQLNDDLTVSDPVVLGFLGDRGSNEPHPETNLPTITYSSRAAAVNNQGIAVGTSTYSDSSDVIRTESFDRWTNQRFVRETMYSSDRATLFIDDAVLPIFPADDREWLQSNASDINHRNIVVGYASKVIAGQLRNRMFYYDINSESMVFPADLFLTANTVPHAINDHGMIVGATEAVVQSVKRKRAFMYSIADDHFVDLNSYVGCDTNYTLVEATSINNDNVILATAVTEVPLRDSFGEVLLDDDGNTRTEFQARAVKLNPIANGTPSDCDTENELNYNRQSASGTVASFFALLMLAGLRLRKRLF